MRDDASNEAAQLSPGERVAAVVLAAGRSRRMGRDKLLLPWGRATVLEATITNLRLAGIARPLVVTPDGEAHLDMMVRDLGAEVVENPAAEAGEMLGSLQRGLKALPATAEAVLVLLGDQPMIGPEVIRAVLDAGRRAAAGSVGRGAGGSGVEQVLVVPEYEGRWGHPVLFGRDHLPDLLALSPGERPRDLLLRRREGLTLLRLDSPEILADLDTEAAYLRWAP
ncbi:MAG: nucleotidyltransferase family protein [Ardenticatenia bacterium]|nr:nucleotidyltransferase family protein [Ardenticatenia bacterium]